MGNFALFLPFLLVMGGFMYFASRKQKRAMQATIDLHDSLQVGDRVHTTSGMEATIVDITDDDVDLEIAPGVVTRWMKLAVRDRILQEDPEEDALRDDDEDSVGELTEGSVAEHGEHDGAKGSLSHVDDSTVARDS